MDLGAIFIQLVRLISRSISRSGSPRPAEKQETMSPARQASEEEKREKERLRKVVTQWQEPHSQPPDKAEKKESPARENKTQENHPPQKKDILVDLPPGESEADEFGLGVSTIGSEKPDKEQQELEELLSQVKQLIQKPPRQKPQGKHQKPDAEKIIRQAEQQPPEPFEERAEEMRQMFEALNQKPKSEMIYFVMYDIENDRVRTKIAKYLEEKGLRRVQKSIFLGQTDRKQYQHIRNALTEIQESYDNHDSIFIVPMPEDYLKSMYIIGQEVDFSLTLHRSNTVFI